MARKPNVIYILADDMGYGDFSAFNSNGPITPALDRMIREGVTLTNCYSASPVCAPARAAILTGRYPQRCGVIDTLEARGLDRLKISETTLADVFKDNGYHTALIGKWHLGAIDPEYHPNNRGFDEFYGFRGGWNDYFNYHWEHNGVQQQCAGKYITDLFSDLAVDYIHAHTSTPFFLHLTYNAPHFPLQVPEVYVEKYTAMGKYTPAVCKLYAMIEVMDEGIGRLLKALDDTGLAQDTIVVFASDNGPDMGGEGDASQKRYNCNLRAEKMYAYEGGIRVPAVVRYPNHYAGNTRCDAVVHGTDWFPSLLSLCGIAVPDQLRIDGLDVSRVLSGEENAPQRELYWQWCRYNTEIKVNSAARLGSAKLVHAPVWEYLDLPAWEVDIDIDIKYHPEHFSTTTDKPVPERSFIEEAEIQLFHLDMDPNEENDLSQMLPEETAAMEERLLHWYADVERDRLLE